VRYETNWLLYKGNKVSLGELEDKLCKAVFERGTRGIGEVSAEEEVYGDVLKQETRKIYELQKAINKKTRKEFGVPVLEYRNKRVALRDLENL
jgi:hypothetical protein